MRFNDAHATFTSQATPVTFTVAMRDYSTNTVSRATPVPCLLSPRRVCPQLCRTSPRHSLQHVRIPTAAAATAPPVADAGDAGGEVRRCEELEHGELHGPYTERRHVVRRPHRVDG